MDFEQAFQTGSNHKIPKSYRLGTRDIREEKLLSEGAFGYIWRAVDVRTGEVFALKRVICTGAERFEQARYELEVMKCMKSSPNLVAYYGGNVQRESKDRATIIILMELCPNGTLFDQMVRRQSSGFNEDHLIKIVDSIARGIYGLHNIGYAHRDIKIENVLIGSDGKYKLCDFGSCTNKIVDFGSLPKSEYDSYQEEMEKHTTPMYRPPEIVDPFLKYKVCEKVDVWMLGCVLYTLCYFAHPFVESNKLAISQAIFKIPKDSRHSRKINDLIRHMLTPNPQYRPSIVDILNLTKMWSQLTEVPLNAEAKQIKLQRERQDKEMEKFDKKVVEFDGDIPLEELRKLQMKVQNSKPQVKKPTLASNKPSSSQPIHINSIVNEGTRKTPPIQQIPKQQSNTNIQTNPNSMDFFNFSQPQTKQQPKAQSNFSTQDLWSQLGSNTSSSQPQKPQNTKNTDFDFFAFPGATQNKQQNKNIPTKSNNFDLLDLGDSGKKQNPPNNDMFKFF